MFVAPGTKAFATKVAPTAGLRLIVAGFLIATALLALSGCASMRGDQPAQPLRVMTFNVRLPAETDGADRWEARRAQMAALIRAQAPDVIGTQELFKTQGDWLVSQLPEYRWFGEGRRGGDGDEHMGVFYRTDRLRVVESGDFWLSDTPDVPGSITWGHPYPRMVTWALFERIGGGGHFYLFNTHLPYRAEDEDARVRGVRLLLARIDALPAGLPVVVTGDFNALPGGPAYVEATRSLRDAWTTAPRRAGPDATFHAFSGKPDGRLDWILVRGFDATSIETLDTNENGRYPSDHFPVVADLVLERAN